MVFFKSLCGRIQHSCVMASSEKDTQEKSQQQSKQYRYLPDTALNPNLAHVFWFLFRIFTDFWHVWDCNKCVIFPHARFLTEGSTVLTSHTVLHEEHCVSVYACKYVKAFNLEILCKFELAQANLIYKAQIQNLAAASLVFLNSKTDSVWFKNAAQYTALVKHHAFLHLMVNVQQCVL